MASYNTDFREQMIRKMMPPNSQSVAQIARDTGVPYATLYTWRKQYQSRGFVGIMQLLKAPLATLKKKRYAAISIKLGKKQGGLYFITSRCFAIQNADTRTTNG